MALHIIVEIDFDNAKRDAALRERGLDFARAVEIFAGITFTQSDHRLDYGEERFITAGLLDGRMVVVVWTHRGSARRIIQHEESQ